jgi:hypothetical protein
MRRRGRHRAALRARPQRQASRFRPHSYHLSVAGSASTEPGPQAGGSEMPRVFYTSCTRSSRRAVDDRGDCAQYDAAQIAGEDKRCPGPPLTSTTPLSAGLTRSAPRPPAAPLSSLDAHRRDGRCFPPLRGTQGKPTGAGAVSRHGEKERKSATAPIQLFRIAGRRGSPNISRRDRWSSSKAAVGVSSNPASGGCSFRR